MDYNRPLLVRDAFLEHLNLEMQTSLGQKPVEMSYQGSNFSVYQFHTLITGRGFEKMILKKCTIEASWEKWFYNFKMLLWDSEMGA